MIRPGRPSALLGAALAGLLAGCGADEPMGPAADPCAAAAPALALGASVSGTLEVEEDCLGEDGRLFDSYRLRLQAPTLLAVTLTTEGYHPFMPLYASGDTVQLSGWASATEPSLTREHLVPAGDYVLRASSFERRTDGDPPAQGGYELSTLPLARPQEGCGRETSVTYGSVATGRLTEDDCEAVGKAGDPVVRRSDGYDFLLVPGRAVQVTATADFPFRLAFWANGVEQEVLVDIAPGESRTLTADGLGFLDFYVRSEEDGVGGTYTLSFREAPGS